MRLLEKLIRQGWWDKSTRPICKIDTRSISCIDIEELWQYKSTIVTDQRTGRSYNITIPADKRVEDLTDDDFEVIDLPGLVPGTRPVIKPTDQDLTYQDHISKHAAEWGAMFIGGKL